MMKLKQVAPLRNSRGLFKPINLSISPGEIGVIMGPSGVGKSSLLDSIAEDLPYSGSITTKGKFFRVFQETDQLFPWMTVHNNLKLADKNIDWVKLTKRWKLDVCLDKLPDCCSVGQRQRLTLLRALHSDKDNILCDEPLSGVDKDTAVTIIDFFKKEVKRTQKQVVWVTHDLNEAKMLGKVTRIKQ